MQRLIPLVFLTLTAPVALMPAAWATDATLPPDIIMQGEDANLNEFKWLKRPLVIFADSPADPRFVQQMSFITEQLTELEKRDVVVLTDTNPDADSALREALHPRGFMVALIGKDGMIKLRKPGPWDVRELSRVIDKMPLRQQEIRDRRQSN